jgi:hypothetical protein
MGHFFLVPWLTPSRPTLLGMAVVAILVFGLSANSLNSTYSSSHAKHGGRSTCSSFAVPAAKTAVTSRYPRGMESAERAHRIVD